VKPNPNDTIESLTSEQVQFLTVKVLTKREYFAAMAMQGLCSNSTIWQRVLTRVKSNEELLFARSAVQYADALIAELNKEVCGE
jgi:hypothetical protein